MATELHTKTKPAVKKKKGRSRFYKIAAWLHLWLGLITGAIMVVVCLCASIWVFQEEITNLIDTDTKVAYEDKPIIQPSRLMFIADSLYPEMKAHYAFYSQGRAINLNLESIPPAGKEPEDGEMTYVDISVNPYTGDVVKVKDSKDGSFDFFSFILNGHRFLWLPYEIGRPIVNYATLIFVVILLSGLILWWPQKWSKATRKQAFTIKTKGSFKRVNYDVHNVLGFYALLVALVLALTGMVYGIEWYSNGLYWTTSGGESLPPYEEKFSDSTQVGKYYTPADVMNKCWNEVVNKYPESKGFFCHFPDTTHPKEVVEIYLYPTAGMYYDYAAFSFDQHTGKRIDGDHPVYDKQYNELSGAGKLRRMNYDIHVGAILGLPGKTLAFFASLIGASLPVTGFLVWWGRRNKKTKKRVVQSRVVKTEEELQRTVQG